MIHRSFSSFLYLFLLLQLPPAFSQTSPPKREFRAIWIATVVNIDWPSESNLSTTAQKREFSEIIKFYKKLNFNAVIVQVRAAGDAFYPSSLEPWSKYLTGTEGIPPSPTYDPLSWMIEESHRNGFEFHAWFNPYRGTFDMDTSTLSSKHAFNQHRDWMIKYGNRFYFNPGLPEVRDYTVRVVMDAVQRYDIDGVHFDDYFYPYKIKDEVFADSTTFEKYNNGLSDIGDWRRANVDSLVKNISDSLRSVKPWVQFGISPFGVWRNASTDLSGSDTQAGQTTYDDLYADPLIWAENQWIDYLAPQLYWSLDYPLASFRKLLQWWSDQQLTSHIYIGHGTYKIKNNSDRAWKKYAEIPKQIQLTRDYSEVQGSVFFSAKSHINQRKRLSRLMIRRNYCYKALTLPSPYLKSETPAPPKLDDIVVDDSGITFSLEQPYDTNRYLVMYGAEIKDKLDISNPKYIMKRLGLNESNKFKISLSKRDLKRLNELAFTYIDRYRMESEPVVLSMKNSRIITTKAD